MRQSLTALVGLLAAAAIVAAPVSGAPEQTPKRGGTVVMAIPRHLEPACLNPYFAGCSSDYLEVVLRGAFEVAPPDYTFRPDLVTAGVVATAPFTLRYSIRPDARWSDGTPVTAMDFVFTQQALLRYRKALRSDISVTGDQLTRVRSVRALDPKTVIVVLRDRWVDWRFLFPWVLPHHALAGEDLREIWKDGVDNPKTGRSIGTGPFLVEHIERGKQLVLRRNPRYWGAHTAYLERFIVRYVAPEDAAEAVRRGEVDMIDASYPVIQPAVVELRRQPAPGVKVVTFLFESSEHFDIRIGPGGHPALRDPLVRRALAFGIDRVEIARDARRMLGETAPRSEPLDSVVFLPNSRFYRPSWKGYRYRPQEARRLLERAGCRPGADGIYVCAGQRLSLRFVAPAVARRMRIVQLAQAQLRRVGVDVVQVFGPIDTVFGQMLPQGDFDFIVFGWNGGAGTAGPYDIFGCQQPSNLTGYCDRLVTRDLRQATRILDNGRRVQLLNRVDARIAKAVPAIPLFQVPGLLAYDTSIRGLNTTGFITWKAENWWLDD